MCHSIPERGRFAFRPFRTVAQLGSQPVVAGLQLSQESVNRVGGPYHFPGPLS